MHTYMKIRKDIAISGAGLVFNPVTGESFSLNPIGGEIIRMIMDGKEFEEICPFILKKYSGERTIFEKDYQDFISLLDQYSLLDHE
jgi:hypothetical protein